MFHPNIYTQKTTAFQKNCGFSVPLIFQGFLAGFDFRYPKMAPQTGLEPVTPRLTAACSTD